MLKLKYVILAAILSTTVSKGIPNVLNESMKSAIVKLGEHCMKSVNASIEDMEALREGPLYTGKSACALACMFDKAHFMKDKTFSKSGFMATITPFMIGDFKKMNHMKQISESCEKEIKSTSENECEIANHIIMCLRKNIPQLAEIKFIKSRSKA